MSDTGNPAPTAPHGSVENAIKHSIPKFTLPGLIGWALSHVLGNFADGLVGNAAARFLSFGSGGSLGVQLANMVLPADESSGEGGGAA